MIYRTVLCLWLVLFLYPGGIRAQVYSDRKVRNFKVTEKTTVEVSNKYGKIHVVTWKKDSARFEVDLRISTNSYQKMDKLRSNIGFDFSGSKSYVKAKTDFSNQAGVISDFVDAFIPSNQVTINYMVYVPEYVNLKIENKFGDIYIDDYNGNLQIELSNGNFSMIVSLQQIEGEYHPVTLRQLFHCLIYPLHIQIIRIQLPVFFSVSFRDILGINQLCSAFLQMIDAFVHHNPLQPGTEGRFVSE